MTGETKNFNQQKYYGYIRGEDGKDYFFHRDDFQGSYDELVFDHYSNPDSIKVEFIPDKTDKGLRARNVTRTEN